MQVNVLLYPLEAKLVHLDSQLQDIVNALALRLRLVNVIAPNVSITVSIQLSYQLIA